MATTTGSEWKTRIVHNKQHPYPDIFDPATPYPMYKLSPLFSDSQLTDAKGRPVSWDSLQGKSVGLYFADDSKPKCKTSLPILSNVYRTFNESGDTQKVEIVFVSLDSSYEAYEAHRAKQPWLALPFQDPLVEKLKAHFRVMNPTEVPRYGYGPRSGVPGLLIIGRDGRLQQRLDICEEGTGILRKWEPGS